MAPFSELFNDLLERELLLALLNLRYWYESNIAAGPILGSRPIPRRVLTPSRLAQSSCEATWIAELQAIATPAAARAWSKGSAEDWASESLVQAKQAGEDYDDN